MLARSLVDDITLRALHSGSTVANEVHPRRGYCYAILSWALDVSSVLRFVLWAGVLKFFLNSMCDHSSMAEHHTGAMKPLTVDPLVSTGDFSVDMLSEGGGGGGGGPYEPSQ